ncbi:hypothetical protein ER308_04480 [Egibacter rhizosphaerae]|uniref:Uncharacterized protein n=1 Tax=Egibacter rhizosphaerae TaxID=1670831 RepID=A0A411YC94_9ACTN|nr:hypothetical protein [Egibacter rhizosphaerae]QBI18873.1 hypothetical protein ER308_04480 [Egibacter rhizosphaerae]
MEPIRYSIDEACDWITVLDSLVENTPPALPVSAGTVVELATVAARAQVEQLLRSDQPLDWNADTADAVAAGVTPIVQAAVCPDAPRGGQVAAIVGELVARTVECVWSPHQPVGRCRSFGDPLAVVPECQCGNPQLAPQCQCPDLQPFAADEPDEPHAAVPGDVRCSSDGCTYYSQPQSVDP